MSKSIVDQLKTIISQDLDVNLKTDEIDENALLMEGGVGLDSVTIVEFISLVEDRFEIQFSDEELIPKSFKNLKVIAEMISQKIK